MGSVVIAADYAPWPRTRVDVRDIVRAAERLTAKRRIKLLDTRWRFDNCLFGGGDLRGEDFSPVEEAVFSLHSLRLAHNQLNEACNKLWTTAEFVHATGPTARRHDRMLVPAFSSTFSLGTLIPALYYATVSSMLAVMTSMGCIFFRDEYRRGSRKDRDLNCVRTSSGWYVMKRGRYASSVLKVGTGDWHQTVVNYYSFFMREGYEAPQMSIEDMKTFRAERDDTHYRVLSETSVSMTADLRLYFERLLFSSKFIGEAIDHVGAIQRDRKGYTDRFDALVASYPALFREYATELPMDDLISLLPTDESQRTLGHALPPT